MNVAVLSLSLEQVSLGEQGGSAHYVPLPRRAGLSLGMCEGFERLLLFSYTPTLYIHRKSYNLGLSHFIVSSLELFIGRYIIAGPGGLAFLHTPLILFSTSCSKTDRKGLGCGQEHLLQTI